MNSFVRIGGALALGTLIVLWAFNARTAAVSNANLGASVVVASANERTYIPPTDTDNNGVSDWEQALADTSNFESIETPVEPTPKAPYEPPETFTGKFSEAFFENFMRSEMHGEQFLSKDTIVKKALTSIDGMAVSKRYSRANVISVPDSLAAQRDYGNRVAEIIVRNSAALPETNEALILTKALEANDESAVAQIEASRAAYETAIREILAVPTPESLVSEHLTLLNALTVVHDDIAAMTTAFEDPLLTLARVGKYQDNLIAVSNSYRDIGNVLTIQGITYSTEEMGQFFYFFTM